MCLASATCWAFDLRRAFWIWPIDASMFPTKEVRTLALRESNRRGARPGLDSIRPPLGNERFRPSDCAERDRISTIDG